ncbi:hypothetical protein ACOJR9_11925 [Alteromonas sp. A081]|uniref:hypothetical protein n=1 Tax=Alteromonas sp. A081 TaxID=3410269 RepID=UPI003B986C46
MTVSDKREKLSGELESSIKHIRFWIFGGVSVLVLSYFGLRLYKDIPFTYDASIWGAVGDFFGGILNPFFSILTIYLLVKSLRLQSQELSEATEQLSQTRTIHSHSLLYESTKKVFERRAETINLLPNLEKYSLSTKITSGGIPDIVGILCNIDKIKEITLDEEAELKLIHLLANLDLELIDFSQAGLDLLNMDVPSYVIRDTLNQVHPTIHIINNNLAHLGYEKHIEKGFSMYSRLFEKAGITFIM